MYPNQNVNKQKPLDLLPEIQKVKQRVVEKVLYNGGATPEKALWSPPTFLQMVGAACLKKIKTEVQ